MIQPIAFVPFTGVQARSAAPIGFSAGTAG